MSCERTQGSVARGYSTLRFGGHCTYEITSSGTHGRAEMSATRALQREGTTVARCGAALRTGDQIAATRVYTSRSRDAHRANENGSVQHVEFAALCARPIGGLAKSEPNQGGNYMGVLQGIGTPSAYPSQPMPWSWSRSTVAILTRMSHRQCRRPIRRPSGTGRLFNESIRSSRSCSQSKGSCSSCRSCHCSSSNCSRFCRGNCSNCSRSSICWRSSPLRFRRPRRRSSKIRRPGSLERRPRNPRCSAVRQVT